MTVIVTLTGSLSSLGGALGVVTAALGLAMAGPGKENIYCFLFTTYSSFGMYF